MYEQTDTSNSPSEYFFALAGTDNYILYGGHSLSSEVMWQHGTARDYAAIIIRMDFSTNARRWANTYGDVSWASKVIGIAI